MTLTTADLINPVYSSNPRLSKVQARETVTTILKIMQARLGSGDDVLCQDSGNLMQRLNQPGKREILKLGKQ